jgi:hypothetical protein
MTELRPWLEYTNWHELFDALCRAQFNSENSQLATYICTLTDSTGEAAYGATLKNLANWRKGQHVPHRKNFGALTKILKIDDHEGLKPQWNRLYTEAKKNSGRGAGIDNASTTTALGSIALVFGARPIITVMVGLFIAIVGLGVGFGYTSGFFQGVAAIGQAEKLGVGRIRHQFYVKLKIGESAIIHGARSRCGEQPAPFEKILSGLPKLRTGIFSDGGMGSRYSRSCNGITPARAVKFTATQKGHEEFSLFGDRTTIDVE